MIRTLTIYDGARVRVVLHSGHRDDPRLRRGYTLAALPTAVLLAVDAEGTPANPPGGVQGVNDPDALAAVRDELEYRRRAGRVPA